MNSNNEAILVVDDEANIRLTVRMALESEGYLVREAPNGMAALEMLNESSIDLMVLDLNMPELDGMAVLQQLQSLPAAERPKVVVLTAYGSVPAAVKAIRLGASDFIEKPASPDDLRSVVNGVLREPKLDLMPGPGQTPDGYEDVVERIRKSLKASDLAGAEDLLADIANRRDERLAEYFNLLGVLYEAQDNWRMARKCYSKGMAANRSYAPAEANMRRFYELYTFGETKQTVALGDEPEYEVKARIDDLMRHQRS